MRIRSAHPALFPAIYILGALLCAPLLVAGEMHPVESQLRRSFPSVALDSSATFQPDDTFVGGHLTSGLRAGFRPTPQHRGATASSRPAAPAEARLRLLYPRSYDGLFVAELGSQRVVIRAIGAAAAPAIESNGKLVYSRPYRSVDVIQVPLGGRSEELLLLQDSRAPLVFEYEIVEMEGVGGVALDNGAIRFLPENPAVPSAADVAGGRFTQPVPSLQIDRPWLIDSSGTRTEKQARWTLIGEGPIPRTIRLTLEPEHLMFPIVVDPSFSATGQLGSARSDHTATLLLNGKVLIVGGPGDGEGSRSAELYDPVSGTFSATGSLATARLGLHTATLLPDGKVLIAGGIGSFRLKSAELYDPTSGTFAATDSLAAERYSATATLLPNGKVLIAGGYGANGSAVTSAELYDTASGTFSATGALGTARGGHTATLLPNGQVLIASGNSSSTAELYDPASGTFSPTGSLATGRDEHTATLLANGKVLIAGGGNDSAELYDPASGTFSATGGLITGRRGSTATLLPNGKVLIVGGFGQPTAAELYDPVSGTFSATGSLATGRSEHTATLLANGKVLIAGGEGAASTLAELYEPASGVFGATASLGTGRAFHTSTQLPNGRLLIAGGANITTGYLASAELFDAGSDTFTSTGSLGTARYGHTATLLPNGKVLVVSGANDVYVQSAELYDAGSGSFSATGTLGTARQFHTATLLANGKVLIAGGQGAGGAILTAELYDPASGTFSATGSLGTARYGHTATLLANGKVLIVGGQSNTSTYLRTIELYDPTSGTFSLDWYVELRAARSNHTATLLPTGKVLIAGGYNDLDPATAEYPDGSGHMKWTELYDPYSGILGTGSLSRTGDLGVGRYLHSATLLPNGKVLIAGGYNSTTGYLASAELYDPTTGTFSTTGSLVTSRRMQTATLLPDGDVLIAGGFNNTSGYLVSAELYDVGQGFAESRRPLIASAPTNLSLPGTLTIVGSGFRAASEAAGGGTNSSATNFPLLQLQRIDNEQSFFVSPTSAFSDVAWSGLLTDLAAGAYRATIFTNAVPSMQHIVQITHPTPTITSISPDRGAASGGEFVTISGTNLLGVTVTIGGSTATVTETTSTTVTFVTPAHAPGAVDVTVRTSSGASATSTGGYTYVANPPTNVSATAATATSVTVTWTAAPGATAYEVLRSSDGNNYTVIAGVTGTTYTDFGAAADTAYLYAVRASAPSVSDDSTPDLATTVIFTDDPLVIGTTTVKAVHLTELRRAVTAVRALAGLSASSWTDPTITPAVTVIKAAHVTELRTALDAARAALSLQPVAYTQGTTVIYASNFTELRNGVK